MARRNRKPRMLSARGVWSFVGVLLVAALCGGVLGWVLLGDAKPFPSFGGHQALLLPPPDASAAKPKPRPHVPADMPSAVSPTPNMPTETAGEEPEEKPAPKPQEAPLPPTPLPPAMTPVPPPDRWVWKDHAQAVDVPAHAPVLAILIDDMGDKETPEDTQLKETSYRAVRALPRAVTLAFFPWYDDGITLAHTAHGLGHEIMVHMPMEPLPHGATVLDPGPHALTVGMDPSAIAATIVRNMKPFADIATGFNNHMGSRFTKNAGGMRTVLTTAQTHGWLFVDSKTAGHTAVPEARKGLALPVLTRDVFLDDDPAPEKVKAQLEKAVALATKQGHALAIGHPLPDTLDVLEEELPKLKTRGVYLVPVSDLVRSFSAPSKK